MSHTLSSTDPPIACQLTSAELAARRQELARSVLADIEQLRELPDGYAAGFARNDERIAALREFIAFESECCPFLCFRLDIGDEQVWLHMTGPGETKGFLERELMLSTGTEHGAGKLAAPERPRAEKSRTLLGAGIAFIAAAGLAVLCCVTPALGVLGIGASAGLAGYLDIGAGGGFAAGGLLLGAALIGRRRRGAGQCGC